MTTRRTQITEFIISNLKKINGEESTFDTSYGYNTNLSGNVYRGIKFIDEINDFPAIYVQTDEEARIYNTLGATEAELLIVLRCYCQTENPVRFMENLTQDIEHVVYHLPHVSDLQIKDILISSISTDGGLLDPYGLNEIVLVVSYELL